MLCKEYVCDKMLLNEVTGFSAKQSGKREMNGDESASRAMLPETKSFLISRSLTFHYDYSHNWHFPLGRLRLMTGRKQKA